ncbi:hypothetical protein GGTG_03637 [Gaeumannomyces tritici R3-111a-1]|uniref:Uncharacterized protein n=1 Tax=Gaeumannomyces tritici (strain R3-111a-1) TaxID=644352 RepID=J3NQT1_GAET3|nr:hypothetical protein GGTG_03637 [Gaeumannomyces tritici R3-111a-1]EJT78537.1 hypothetical protein GGTG_03637 [Gaeumannomyces tritici R3-111a-1]
MSAVPKAKFTTPVRPLTFLITSCSSGLGLCLARAVQGATSRKPGRTPDLVAKVERRGGPFEIIFFGLPRLARAAVAHMRRRRFGVVVNMSSGAGLEGVESMGAYAAAKSALNGEFGFRTNMRNVARIGSVPLADDYKGKEFAEVGPCAVRQVHGGGILPGRNSSVVTKHQTTLVTVSRAANSTLSRTWLNGTITGTTRSTNRTATFQWTPPTPTLPYRCAMRDCWRHPKDKDRQWCEQEDREKCKKEWESIQSEVWATSRLVNDAVGENARQTVKKMNSQEFKEGGIMLCLPSKKRCLPRQHERLLHIGDFNFFCTLSAGRMGPERFVPGNRQPLNWLRSRNIID